MPVTVELRVMELLNARLCHELISPVGAINNGVELVAEEDADADFQRDAMKLIASSAKTAGHRLNFYRFAYGSGRGSTGKDASAGLLEGSKVKLDWNEFRLGLAARMAAPSRQHGGDRGGSAAARRHGADRGGRGRQWHRG